MAYIVDGVYNIEEMPPIEVQGVPTGVWGIVGTFSKGPVNTPTYITSLNDLKNQFGGVDTSLTGYLGALSAFGQGATQAQVVRITGTGATAASVTVNDSSNSEVFKFTYNSVGAGGNSASVATSQGTKQGSFKVVVTDGDTVETTDNVVTVLPANPTTAPTLTATGTGGTLAAGSYTVGYTLTNSSGETQLSPTATVTITAGQNIQVSAITLPSTETGVNYYMSVSVGSSTLAYDAKSSGTQTTLTALPAVGAENPPASSSAQNGFTLVTNVPSQVGSYSQPGTPNTDLPVSGTYPLSGGANGSAPLVSDYIGTTSPNTGLQALSGTSPKVNLVFLAGQSDPTIPATLKTFCNANNCIGVACDPKGTVISTAKSDTANLDTDRVVFAWPWQQMFVSDLDQTVTVPPTGHWVGRVATLYPHQSPGNKSLQFTDGPEFAVSDSDVATAMDPTARIVPMGVPIPRGGIGIRSGDSLSQTATLRPVYRRRMTDFIVASINTALGQFVDEPITASLLFDQQHTVSNFLESLKGPNNEAGEPMIEDYTVQCDAKNNTSSVTQNDQTVIDTYVKLFNINKYLLFRTQIGASVITTNEVTQQ